MRRRLGPAPDCRVGGGAGMIGGRFERHGGGMKMAEVSIKVSRNGPYLVKGSVELTDADGTTYTVKQSFALCRCGGSTTKPFCDGTHSKIGFQAAEQAVARSTET